MGRYGLLGEKLTHSFSPQIHSCLSDYEYLLYERNAEQAREFILSGDYDGLNVTIPYKKLAYSCCDALSDNAKKIGSVNTIVKNADGTLYGDNTDYFGFKYMLTGTGAKVEGCKAVVLGSGGSSLTVQAVLCDMGVSEVVVISRSGQNNYENIDMHYDASVVVNTTPVGMFPNNGNTPVDISKFTKCKAVLDLIYNPNRTKLLIDAEDMGIKCESGLGMLVAQAVRASEIFTGDEYDKSVIEIVTRKIILQTKNIALIGMPGCGKTSIGAVLARKTGREFFDADEIIEMTAGKSISAIFEDEGEEAFRELETKVFKELSAKCGCVIATGGGIVKKNINRECMRQNSIAVYLDREVSELPVKGRPLSIKSGVFSLAVERIPIYKEWSDLTVKVDGIEQTADMIISKLML